MTLRKTPLNSYHKELKGRIVPFAGWEMPVQYTSIIEEHLAVRKSAGIFDVSHMGEISVKGENASNFLDSMTLNSVSDLVDGQVQYNAVPNNDGGLIDDITLYKVQSDDFFVVANASNYEKVYEHLRKHAPAEITVTNESDSYHQIALQGPVAESILSSCLKLNFSNIQYYHFDDIYYNNKLLRISRTGYTGEDGFEIYSDIEMGIRLWNDLLTCGKDKGLIPCGLGSRDSLRLEARYPLYGHELNETLTPVESGIGWIVKEKQIKYPGYDRIIDHKKNGVKNKIYGFLLKESGVPRDGYDVVDDSGKVIGKVLSGGFSPILKCGMGTTLLPSNFKKGDPIYIQIRDKKIKSEITAGAFVNGTARKK